MSADGGDGELTESRARRRARRQMIWLMVEIMALLSVIVGAAALGTYLLGR